MDRSLQIRRGEKNVKVNRTLYKLSPRTSIEKYHVLRSSAWSSWIPVHGSRWRLGWGLPTGKKKSEWARRTSRSLGGIGLFDLNFLQLLLQPSRIDDRHGLRSVVGCGVWGAGYEYGVKVVGLVGC